MNGCVAKDKKTGPANAARKGFLPNAANIPSEHAGADREAFWAGALESASMLAWIVSHSPNPEHPRP